MRLAYHIVQRCAALPQKASEVAAACKVPDARYEKKGLQVPAVVSLRLQYMPERAPASAVNLRRLVTA